MKRRYHHQTIHPIKATEPHVKALFRYIDKQELTLRTVAEKAGMDASVLGNWRRGEASPRLDLFVAVCGAVGVMITLDIRVKKSNGSTIEQLTLDL